MCRTGQEALEWIWYWSEDGLERDAGEKREERTKNTCQPNVQGGFDGRLEDLAKVGYSESWDIESVNERRRNGRRAL